MKYRIRFNDYRKHNKFNYFNQKHIDNFFCKVYNINIKERRLLWGIKKAM
nr:MAG TPA: hypothetical protein [Caudoviricetes sp.]